MNFALPTKVLRTLNAHRQRLGVAKSDIQVGRFAMFMQLSHFSPVALLQSYSRHRAPVYL